jgi:hypothetical protein
MLSLLAADIKKKHEGRGITLIKDFVKMAQPGPEPNTEGRTDGAAT